MPHNHAITLAALIIAALLILGLFRQMAGKWGRNANPILQRAREHLKAVRGAPFQPKPLANRLEKAAYQTAVDIVAKRGKREQILLQVSLGEIL